MSHSTIKLLLNTLLISLTIAITVSCEPKNDENLVPSYLKIDKINLTSTELQGSNSSNITDAWVYLDETLIGSFELPCTVPILSNGKQTITIRPGIKLNGISNTRAVYPFYKEIKQEINLVRDSVTDLTPTTTYEDKTEFPWLEGFEFSEITLDTTAKSTVGITRTNDPAQIFIESGNLFSGLVTMAQDSAIFESVTKDHFEFPENGGYVFLEINYKINHPLVVGVFYTTGDRRLQRPMVTLNKTDEWKKIYINLTVVKYDTPSAEDFQIFIGAQKENDIEEATFLLDNLKLVRFNTSK